MHSLLPFVIAALGSLTSAADCSGPRPSNAPSGADLAKLAKAKLDDACAILSGSTGPAWSQYPNSGYYYQGSNPKSVLADPKFCHDSFEQIIDQCISNGKFYGGQFFFDHQVFNLTNAKGKDSPIGVLGYVNPPSPPPFPDDSGVKFFEGMTCGFGSIGNAQSPGELRWGEAGCDDALQRFNGQWNPSTSNLNYVASMSSFWHGPEDWTCTVRQDKCVAGVQTCGDSDTSGPNGHSITNPAAWMILNSFSNIYNFYFNQFLSFTLAQNDISPQIHDFASKFSPVPNDDTEILKLILDVLSMGYGQIAAGAWNTVLKDASIFKDGTLNHGWSKDGVNNIISGMITTGKDLLPGKKDAIGRENDLTSMLNTLVQAYEDTTSGFLNNIFGGSSDGITALTSMLDNGKWIDPTFNGGKQLDLPTMRGIVEKILFAQLMPLAWKDVGGLHPVVLIDDKICSGGSGDFDANLYITKDQQNAVGACYKSPAGDHSVGLYLLSINDDTRLGPVQKPPPGGPKNSRRSYPVNLAETQSLEKRRLIDPDSGDLGIFDLLPGGDRSTLNGNDWAGIQVEDLMISSYEAWVLNHNANGYTMPDDSKVLDGTGNEGTTIFQNGIRTPGVFSIPVCTVGQAHDNWRKHQFDNPKPQYYPCNS